MAYQFSFDPNPGWSRVFAPGAEVRAYLRGMVDRYGLQPHIELRTSVSSRTWDEQEHVWRVVLNGTREITTRYVVSAIGVFPEPKPAQIDGIGEFRGKIMHSTTWDENYDIAGKRVAVVGTGASALQIVPAIASQVAHLDVYQRTPIWVLKKFDPDIPPWMKDLFTRVPLATRLGNRIVTALSELFTIKLPVHHAKAPWFAHRIERAARDHLERSVCDPVLRRQLTPDYGFACKRPSFSNTYLAAFERDNVDLVTDTIEQITPEGIRTVDGKDRPVDAIVLATGFHMAFSPEVYRRSPVVGRNGFNLADYFERERYQAYESITMPGLPNHFMIYGPYGGRGCLPRDGRKRRSPHRPRHSGSTPARRDGGRGDAGSDRALPPGRRKQDDYVTVVHQQLRRRQQLLLRSTWRRHRHPPHLGTAVEAGKQDLPAQRLPVRDQDIGHSLCAGVEQ